MPQKTKSPPECFTFMLAKAYQKAHGHFRKTLEPYGLTNIQHAVLEALWYQDGQTAVELGQLLVLDKATLSGVLARMQDSGWTERRPDPHDGREGRRLHVQSDVRVGDRHRNGGRGQAGIRESEIRPYSPVARGHHRCVRPDAWRRYWRA